MHIADGLGSRVAYALYVEYACLLFEYLVLAGSLAGWYGMHMACTCLAATMSMFLKHGHD